MLSDETNNDCVLIRENLSGTQVWAKLYAQGRCDGFAIDSSENYAY